MIISVVTVSFNACEELRKTIESVYAQTTSKFEYIVIDGGSEDGTLDLLKKYEELFTERGIKYYYVSEKDNGIYDAMNKSLYSTEGDYVHFLNAGDLFYNEYVLEDFFGKIDTDDEIIYGNYCLFHKEFYKIIHSKEPKYLNDGMPCTHQAFFIKTKLIMDTKYNTEYKMAADYDFFLSMYQNGVRFKHINLIVVNFAVSGLSQKKAKTTQEDKFLIKYRHNLISEKEYEKRKLKIFFICLKKWIISVTPDFIRFRKYNTNRA